MTIQRWTDEMLDGLASSVDDMRESMIEMRGSMTEMRDSITDVRDSITDVRDSITDVRDSITDVRDSVDGLRVTTQALLQVAAQNQQRMDRFDEEIELMKQQFAESDERFNVLLAEVRYLIRGNQEESDHRSSNE